jgi:hypothetical protein
VRVVGFVEACRIIVYADKVDRIGMSRVGPGAVAVANGDRFIFMLPNASTGEAGIDYFAPGDSRIGLGFEASNQDDAGHFPAWFLDHATASAKNLLSSHDAEGQPPHEGINVAFANSHANDFLLPSH